MINARQYLISFLATIQGHKAVISGLRQMESGQKGLGKETEKGDKKGQSFNDMLNKASKRALIVAPVWLLLRSIMMGFIRVITNMVKANIDLEDGMARIRTVMQGTAKSIDRDMIIMKRAILDMAMKTSMGLKDLSEAMYFLKTASLTAEEALSAFPHVINAVLGTGASLKTMVRAIAGAYNTMGKFMDDSLTTSEKFQQIADALTYTFATQEVEMDELVAGYMKLAPYVSGLEDNFGILITILGVLNTKMLKSGRTGRLLGRAILQITKNSSKLAQIFGVTFEPDKPVSLLKVLKAIALTMKEGAKVTAEQGQAIQEVFATRAGVPVRLLIKDMETLIKAIELAGIEMEGFTEHIAKIRELTVSRQMKRLSGILSVLTNDFISGVYGAGDFAKALSAMNDNLETLRLPLRRFGQTVGWLGETLAISALAWEQFFRRGLAWDEEVIKMKLYIRTLSAYIKEHDKAVEITEKEKETLEKVDKTTKELGETSLTQYKEEQQNLKHTIALLKIRGASAVDIAKYKLDQIEASSKFQDALKRELDLQKARDALMEAQERRQKTVLDIIEKARINLLKARGAGELEILKYKEQQLNADRSLIGEGEYLLRLIKLRVQSAIEFSKLKDKELQTATDLYRQYAKADEEERKQIERMMDLVKMTPGELSRAVRDPFDFAVIDRFWKYFTKRQREAMGESLRREEGLDKFRSAEAWQARTKALEEYSKKYWEWIRKGAPEAEKPIEPIAVGEMEEKAFDFARILGNITKDIFQNWIEEGSKAIRKLKEEAFRQEWGLVEKRPGVWEKPGFENLEERRKIQKQFAGLGVTIDIKNIEIVLPKEAIDRYAEEAGERVKEKVKEAIPELKKRIDEALQEL